MLMLTRKLSGGALLIKDRRVKKDADGKPELKDGKKVYEKGTRILKATDPNLYEANEYGDEEYVLQHHGAIMARPKDVPKEWWDKMKSRIKMTKKP